MPCLSKTLYVRGLQCPKLLWHSFHQPEALAASGTGWSIFDQGREVGTLARKLFPGGIEVGQGADDLHEALARTRQALEFRRPLFEATFATDHALARVDLLAPAGVSRWDVMEVKSAASAKAVHCHDLAFQVRVLRDCGVNVRRAIFETLGPAIPLFDGTRPFEAVPFQFSLHVQREPAGGLEHRMYLAEGVADPRPEFMQRLRAALGDAGSVIVWNAAFEKGVLTRCAEPLPEFGPWVGTVKRRVVDLLTPFKSFHYYHPQQHGSASSKAVMPAVTGRGYGELDIQEGATASQEFLRVTFSNVPAPEREHVRRQLELYCGRDTEGMVWILEALRRDAGR